MATMGPWVLLDKALGKIQNVAGPINLTSGSIKSVLTTSAQPITHSFVGSSTDARYADLTNELTTANGYTAGGVALSGLSVSGSSNVYHWTASAWGWTLVGSITFKYCLLYDNAAANKDLLAYVDMDTSSGLDITAITGALQYTPDVTNGIFKWIQ